MILAQMKNDYNNDYKFNEYDEHSCYKDENKHGDVLDQLLNYESNPYADVTVPSSPPAK